MAEFRRYWAFEFYGGGGPATRALSQHIGACIAWAGERASLSPNHLTFSSLCTSVTAALLYATLAPGWASILLCLFLYQLAYGFDCADGQLARATGQTSEFGGWLDISVDTVTVLAQAFAILFLLISRSDLIPLAFICIAIMTIGRILSLYSSNAVGGSAHARQSRPFTLAELPKKALWLVFDTPVFLTMVCVLRDTPRALMLYAVAMGCVFTAQAIYLGLRFKRN